MSFIVNHLYNAIFKRLHVIFTDLPSSSSDISTFNIGYGIACSSKTTTVVNDIRQFIEFEVDTTKGKL